MTQSIRDSLEDHLGDIRGLVRRYARDEGIVDDITQECCVRVIEKEKLWNPDRGEARPWLFAVAHNVARNWFRRPVKEKTMHDTLENEAVADPASADFSDEHIRWVVQQFGSLPERQREVMKLRYFDSKKNIEIADTLGMSPSAVSLYTRRALDTLRKRARAQGLMAAFLPWNWSFTDLLDFLESPRALWHTLTTSGKLVTLTAVTVVAAGTTTLGMKVYEQSESINRAHAQLALAAPPTPSTKNPVTAAAKDDVDTLTALPQRASLQQSLWTLQAELGDLDSRIENRRRLLADSGSGELPDIEILYYPSGRKELEVPLKDGYPHGVSVLYYDIEGSPVESRCPYVKGRRHGLKSNYAPDGRLVSEIPFVRGRREGMGSRYHHTGFLEKRVSFENNIISGLCIHYDKEGRIIREIPHANNLINGVVRAFDTQGRMTRLIPHVNNRVHGVVKEFDNEGNLKREVPHADNRVHGVVKEFDVEGNVRRMIPHHMGRVEGMVKDFDSNGNLIGTVHYRDGNPVLKR